jgi:hypothetical protein
MDIEPLRRSALMEPERAKSPPDTSCGLFSHVSTSDKPGRHVDQVERPESVHRQILDEIMGANLRDDSQIWYLQPDRTYLRSELGDNPFEAHRYFMSSPSLSGRGTSLKDQLLT